MKKSLIALATTAVTTPKIARIEMSPMEREVALRIPTKQAKREVSRKLAADLDAALQQAVERHLGHAVTQPSEVAGRLTHAELPDGTTYRLDGVPILWAGPVTWQRENDVVTGERQLRQIDGVTSEQQLVGENPRV